MPNRPPIDWEAIERDWRAGILSANEIARRHGCSRPAITKRADRLGWKRDLAPKIHAAAAAKTAEELARVASGEFPDAASRDAAIVEDASNAIVVTTRIHVERAVRLRALADRCAGLLEKWLGETSKGKAADKRRVEALSRLMAGKGDGIGNTLRAIGDAQERAMKMERTALGLDVADRDKAKAPVVVRMEI